MKQEGASIDRAKAATFPKKLAWLAVLAAVVALGYVLVRERLTLDALAAQESHLRELRQQHPVLSYGAAFLFYALVTGLSLPGAWVLTLAYGWIFGLARGVILVSFASTTGATLAFLLSRYLFRDAVESRFGDRLARLNEQLRRDGPFYLFTLRLIPAVPFVVINAVMGLTPMHTWTYWWVSQLGMLPATAVYVYAGSSVPSLETLAREGLSAVFSPGQLTRILIAFAFLGFFPLVVRLTLRCFGIVAKPADESDRHIGTTA